ncbi:MAG: Fe-S cluster assembly protein SufD [Gammaproteobacteria bacterium]|jgi:Fe-S cluster assembly protein SufD
MSVAASKLPGSEAAGGDVISRYRTAFETVESQLPGHDLPWLRTARQSALAAFGKIGLPKPRDENWKYTRIAPIERREFTLSTPTTSAAIALDKLLFDESVDAHQLVFVDGIYRAELSKLKDLPAGAVICDLRSAFAAHASSVESMMDHDGSFEHGFSALNSAFASDGVLIKLERNVRLAHPVHLLFVASESAETIAHPRVLVDCAAHSALDVVEQYTAQGNSVYFNNATTQVRLGECAELNHYKLQRESSKAFHVATMSVHQQSGSSFTSHSISLGAALARHAINVAFAAPDSQCTLNGLYITRGRQHVDYHTRVDHEQPSCTSKQDYRGILADRSRGVFNACAYVHPHAQKSDATQSNKNLLLSNDAEIDTKPQLEIYADDVKCAHGTTVGQLDEEKIFYLRSRGLDEDTARGLLIYGFARDVLDGMKIEPIREIVTQALLEQLPNGADIRSMLS